MKNSKLIYYGIINSLGVFFYVSGVAWFLFNGKELFKGADTFWQPVMMLLLFVVSAAITVSLVFGRPVCFYLEGMKKEAVRLSVYTIVSLFIITLMVFAGNIIR